MDRRSFSGSDIPSDIWWRVMENCAIDEVLSLEKCCRLFYSLAKRRTIWVKCVQNMGTYEPPSMPRHISPISLSTQELRNIAIKARLWNSLWKTSYPLKATRETVISLEDANPEEVLGEPVEFGLQLFLLPGGNHLMLYWPAGYLQCWSVHDKTCLWVYPDLPRSASEDRPKLLWNFDFDVQQNGDVHLLLIDEYIQDGQMGDRYPNIMRFSPGTSSLEKLHSGRQLKREYGVPTIVILRGNVSVVYQSIYGLFFGALIIYFRDEEKSLTVPEVNLDCLEIADDFMICVCRLNSGDKSLLIVSLIEMLKMATSMSGPPKTVSLADIMSSAVLLEPKSLGLRNATLSVNTLHWKAERDQDKIHVTVLYKDTVSRGTPFAHFVLHKGRDRSGNSSRPHLEILSFEDDNDEVPLKLSDRTFASYTTLTPPTLSGQSLVLLHSSHVPAESKDELALATLLCDGKIKFKPFDLGAEYSSLRPPCMEFYSGAILFVTEDYSSVVIKYFD